jgi:hypothetical protein
LFDQPSKQHTTRENNKIIRSSLSSSSWHFFYNTTIVGAARSIFAAIFFCRLRPRCMWGTRP